ncbi:MAG: glycogen synthase [Planctomycetota bacterium]|nr:glycogen synthase [Planctomycetota bacterium]
MYICMLSTEMAPIAKVGGLADVVTALSRELQKRGHVCEIIMPMYSCMRYDLIEDLHCVYEELWVPHYGQWRAEKVFSGRVAGVNCLFITCGNYTERSAIYGREDDIFLFTYFSRAALEFMYKTERRPEIIHCHDWGTALVPVMYYEIYGGLGWGDSRCVFTIHNNECQGLCWYGDKLLGMVGMDVSRVFSPEKLQDDNAKNCINLMKGAIVYSNFITTVSPTFGNEMKSSEGGRGLNGLLNRFSNKFGGIINGIDYDVWNPATDGKLAANYSLENFERKYENKRALREWLHLSDEWKPIIAVVTRLTAQKGLDLIKHAVRSSLGMGAQFVLLGESPDGRVNGDFWNMKNSLGGNSNVHLWIGYHEELSHLIYAGADLFLIPSLFEPCGLTQLISLRYGTVPMVRRTGGLADTVFDLDRSGRGLEGSNGYVFGNASTGDLDETMSRAIRTWFDAPEVFTQLARNGMSFNYSWENPAKDYENIYNYIKAK